MLAAAVVVETNHLVALVELVVVAEVLVIQILQLQERLTQVVAVAVLMVIQR
jgi:hypothetical protein